MLYSFVQLGFSMKLTHLRSSILIYSESEAGLYMSISTLSISALSISTLSISTFSISALSM